MMINRIFLLIRQTSFSEIKTALQKAKFPRKCALLCRVFGEEKATVVSSSDGSIDVMSAGAGAGSCFLEIPSYAGLDVGAVDVDADEFHL